MRANTLALGRNHSTCDTASLTAFSDCFRVNIHWADGAYVYCLYDTKQEAETHLTSLGFYLS